MKDVKILSKEMALFYLYHEFGNVNLKVTTDLNENGTWTGKISLEETKEPPKDDKDFLTFYLKAFEQEKKLQEERGKQE